MRNVSLPNALVHFVSDWNCVASWTKTRFNMSWRYLYKTRTLQSTYFDPYLDSISANRSTFHESNSLYLRKVTKNTPCRADVDLWVTWSQGTETRQKLICPKTDWTNGQLLQYREKVKVLWQTWSERGENHNQQIDLETCHAPTV
jgi:hypothetical protein